MRTDIVAVLFDFDDTLAPDSTTALLQAHNVDTKKFWQQDVPALVTAGYDPPAAWLNSLLKLVGLGKPLGELTNAKLKEFGASLDNTFYPGLPEFFDDLRSEVKNRFRNMQIEFYIISGGLYEIMAGTSIVQNHFKAVYGCHLAGDDENGVLKYIKRSITFTEKTRYVFEIHKGLDPSESWKKPTLVNKFVAEDERRIPLKNMIYVGDGLTDIPCFSLLKKFGGHGFGILHKRENKPKEALEEFLKTDRVVSMHGPDYRKEADLAAILRAAVVNKCVDIQLSRPQARG